MSSSNRFAVLVALTSLCLFVVPARAQQVLACYTLHNDLANFDRRARQVDHYFMPELKAARAAVADAHFSQCAFNESGEACIAARQRDWADYRRLRGIYDRSRLGGSDVIRLRIIDQMRYYGCPLPEEAFLYSPPPAASGSGRPAGVPLVYK